MSLDLRTFLNSTNGLVAWSVNQIMPQYDIVSENEDYASPDLVELKIEMDQSSNFSIFADLRISCIAISFSETRYRVGLVRAKLFMEMEGFKSKIGRRYGDMNEIGRDIVQHQKKTNSAKMIIDAAISKNGANLDAKVGAARETSDGSESIGSHRHSGVRSLPNNSWSIERPDSKRLPIEASLLVREKLCEITPKIGANRHCISFNLAADLMDFTVTSETDRRRIRQINRDRVIALLASKCLADRLTGRRHKAGMPIQLATCSQEFKVSGDE